MDTSLPITIIERGKGLPILVTAGSDGDEYDGIEAAKQIISDWQGDSSWTGTRMIIPIINQMGYDVGVSWQPLDGKFPKTIFPGKKDGTISERLIHDMWTRLPVPPELWIDLHGGHRNESLTPFVWGFPYGNTKVKQRTLTILSHISGETIYAPWLKVKAIATLPCVYIVCESGERGNVNPSSVQQHIYWVKQIIDSFQLSPPQQRSVDTLYYLTVPETCYWQPTIKKGMSLVGGYVCGQCFMEMSVTSLTAHQKGTILWHHTGGWVRRGEVVAVIRKKG